MVPVLDIRTTMKKEGGHCPTEDICLPLWIAGTTSSTRRSGIGDYPKVTSLYSRLNARTCTGRVPWVNRQERGAWV